MSRSPRRSQHWKALEKCQGKCWYCGYAPADGELTVDHAKPSSRGGKNQEDNLLPACTYCNNLKANLTLKEWRKFVKVRIIRDLLCLGYCSGDMGKIKIIFFGEGNDSPFSW